MGPTISYLINETRWDMNKIRLVLGECLNSPMLDIGSIVAVNENHLVWFPPSNSNKLTSTIYIF